MNKVIVNHLEMIVGMEELGKMHHSLRSHRETSTVNMDTSDR